VIDASRHAWRIETAFVDHAVVNVIRGPTSKISVTADSELRARTPRKLSLANPSGSKVSDRSQVRAFKSLSDRDLSAATLKQYSVPIP
jgi:hypothetical protein